MLPASAAGLGGRAGVRSKGALPVRPRSMIGHECARNRSSHVPVSGRSSSVCSAHRYAVEVPA